MSKPYVAPYFRYWKMIMDTTAVLNYRLPLLNSMVLAAGKLD